MKKIIGRRPDCDYVVFDPKNRVSRTHAELEFISGRYAVTDLNSSNGTFVNGVKIPAGKKTTLNPGDRLTLSVDYKIDFQSIFRSEPVDPEATRLFDNSPKQSVKFDNEKTVFMSGSKTLVFDTEKTAIGDLIQMDESPYFSVGRTDANQIKIDNPSISRQHCKIKLLAPMMIEIIDLGSANGTFADDLKLEPNKKYQFSSSVIIKLGLSTTLDLKKVFKDKIEIIKKIHHTPVTQKDLKNTPKDNNATPAEMEEFNELENLWKEYSDRMQKASGEVGNYMLGGQILSGAAHFLGPAGVIVGIGVSIFSRYLGMQKSNSIKNDVNYEEAFLTAYSCPRCEESFQKKPWVTIRDCSKCRTKFR